MSHEVRFKVGGKAARESIAAVTESSPWYAKPQLAALMEKVDELGIEISIRRARPKHTDEQRGYYHMGVGMLAKHLGMSHDECHEQVLIEAFGSSQIAFMGRVVSVPRTRSSKLPTEAYSELIETLLRVGAWAGCVIPDPQMVA